jgi:hypothetical protein
MSGMGFGGVSNVDIDGNNTLHVKAIGVVISTFETLPAQCCNGGARRVLPAPPSAPARGLHQGQGAQRVHACQLVTSAPVNDR